MTSIAIELVSILEFSDFSGRDVECYVLLDESHEASNGISRERHGFGRVVTKCRIVNPAPQGANQLIGHLLVLC